MSRVLVAGIPRCGKTTFSGELLSRMPEARLLHTDDLLSRLPPLGWSEQSEAVSRWFDDEPGPWIIEGVTVVRALRKWLERVDAGKPADVLYWSERELVPLTAGQRSMGKGCATVYREVRSLLLTRGVELRMF